MPEPHHWQFFSAGGVDQVVIRSGADIAHIGELDQKLWVALACPTRGIEFDARTLDLVDTDHDGRIRPPELIAACEWACAQLRDPDLLLAGGDTLALEALADDPAASIQLVDEARRVLALAGREGASRISLQEVTERSEHLAAMRFNGDGVVTPETAKDDAAVQRTLLRIMQTHGSLKDRNGRDGIDRQRAEAFFADAEAMRAWQAGDDASACLGGGMLEAAEAVDAVREKVDDFFARCRVAAYDIQAVAALNASSETYEALAAQALSLQADGLAALPLAAIRPGRSLPLREGANPAWAAALEQLRRKALAPLLGAAPDALDEAQWVALQQRLAPCRNWLARKPANALAAEDGAGIEALLASRAALMALVDEDESVEQHNARLVDLERLLRFQRDLVRLLDNFVSFKAFYRREGAIFQAGTLYLDGRSCELTVQVADARQHAVLAGLAKTCLAYCECRREGRTMGIVAAFTAGDVDFLFVGRNGLFYDRQGRDWDATITRLIENPTSVAQAFFSPYKKFVRLIEEQVAKRAAASEAGAQGTLGTLASTLANADKAAVPGAAAPATARLAAGSRIDVGTVAAIGVAMGSISAVLVALFSKFIDLGQWIPIAILGMVCAISGPSMLIAWLKLRQRSLGPILDASGWAINGRMKVNVRLGASLSKTAQVPRHALRFGRDPYADRRGVATALAALALMAAITLLAWESGWLRLS
ncbi:hypothetical protein QTI33_01455 [Variovorax sp. J22P271]|uniref:hypothetical protein n=1 Tax=Variovorax davisae TaxID=3053515 RepID=UPI0025749B73|nr:hypothetical protein [Variovorax sp. J22P271]MDM0030804.1 hypothetical protein [Variovorax sp. J22P271]